MQQSEPANFASGDPEQRPQEQPSVPSAAALNEATPPDLTLISKPHYRWYDKVGAVMAAIFCFELGLFLLVYPWITEWEPSPGQFPLWARLLWDNPWFRGGLSGLGVINIWISFVEVFRFRRFSA